MLESTVALVLIIVLRVARVLSQVLWVVLLVLNVRQTNTATPMVLQRVLIALLARIRMLVLLDVAIALLEHIQMTLQVVVSNVLLERIVVLERAVVLHALSVSTRAQTDLALVYRVHLEDTPRLWELLLV